MSQSCQRSGVVWNRRASGSHSITATIIPRESTREIRRKRFLKNPTLKAER